MIKPILFSTPMVIGIDENRKLQTRRIIKPQPIITDRGWEWAGTRPKAKKNTGSITCWGKDVSPCDEEGLLFTYAKYKVGDILWVRETYREIEQDVGKPRYEYKATETINLIDKWKPSIFMPKDAARFFLEVTNVRVERLHDISEKDAITEGVLFDDSLSFNKFLNYHTYIYQLGTAKESFQSLWETINGLESWESNPFVWVYEFKKVEKPVNFK